MFNRKLRREIEQLRQQVASAEKSFDAAIKRNIELKIENMKLKERLGRRPKRDPKTGRYVKSLPTT